MFLVAALIAVVTLGSPFGDAQAGAVSIEEGMTVEVTVVVDASATVVVVRPFSSFEELPPTALSNLGDGRWGGFVELPTAENWSVVFDAFTPEGETFRSDTTDLLALGVDRALVGAAPTAATGGWSASPTTVWLALAFVFTLASLGALAWWALAGDVRGSAAGTDLPAEDADDDPPPSIESADPEPRSIPRGSAWS